jgi:hypothetical protein
MVQFLLNSNKSCESENKEGISSTGGKSVTKSKNRKYDDSYLDFGFTSTNGKERPQCALCMKVLASECMLPHKLKHHLETTHPSIVSKFCDYFSRKLKELNQQKGVQFYSTIWENVRQSTGSSTPLIVIISGICSLRFFVL